LRRVRVRCHLHDVNISKSQSATTDLRQPNNVSRETAHTLRPHRVSLVGHGT
jgi:hypothetical protein